MSHVTKNCVQLVINNYKIFKLHVSFAIENQLQMMLAKC